MCVSFQFPSEHRSTIMPKGLEFYCTSRSHCTQQKSEKGLPHPSISSGRQSVLQNINCASTLVSQRLMLVNPFLLEPQAPCSHVPESCPPAQCHTLQDASESRRKLLFRSLKICLCCSSVPCFPFEMSGTEPSMQDRAADKLLHVILQAHPTSLDLLPQ